MTNLKFIRTTRSRTWCNTPSSPSTFLSAMAWQQYSATWRPLGYGNALALRVELVWCLIRVQSWLQEPTFCKWRLLENMTALRLSLWTTALVLQAAMQTRFQACLTAHQVMHPSDQRIVTFWLENPRLGKPSISAIKRNNGKTFPVDCRLSVRGACNARTCW